MVTRPFTFALAVFVGTTHVMRMSQTKSKADSGCKRCREADLILAVGIFAAWAVWKKKSTKH